MHNLGIIKTGGTVLKLLFAVLAVSLTCRAQTIDLYGTVTTPSGAPAANVLLTLETAGLSATTDQLGIYAISNTTNVNGKGLQAGPLDFRGSRKILHLKGVSQTPFIRKTLQGAAKAGLYDIHGNRLAPAAIGKRSGLYFTRPPEKSDAPSAAPLAKAAAEDNMLLSFAGEHIHTVPVEAYTGQLNITLPAELPTATVGEHTLNFDKLVFIKRETFQSRGGHHYYGYFFNGHNIEYTGNIYIRDLNTGAETKVVPSMDGGIFNSFDLSFDGTKIVFDYKPQRDKGFRLWEVNVDGTGLKQLTVDPPDEAERIQRFTQVYEGGENEGLYSHNTDDLEPCYLPDGGIAFTSTRPEYEVPCIGTGEYPVPVLHRIDGDGSNMVQLSHNPASEFSPSVSNDGRILYNRWEYVNKGQLVIKCIWAMNVDGSNSVEVFGNNIASPPTLITPMAVPGNDNLVICIGAVHYPQGAMGPVLEIDTRKDIRTAEPMTYITPMFKDPYPLSESLYLVSYKPIGPAWNDPSGYHIALLDRNGATTTVFEDSDISLWNPVPLKARPKPGVATANYDVSLIPEGLAQAIVLDIYEGMEGVPRGSVKWIRINEHVPRPWGAFRYYGGIGEDAGYTYQLGRGTHIILKVQHGIVPVEADGSANFYVPADKNIFFQALDADYCEVQQERTFINFRPGEVASCIGCHEKKGTVPSTGIPAATLRAPDHPGPQPGETTGKRVLHYPTDVQPVLDQHCVSCHGNYTGDPTNFFSESYEALINEGAVGPLLDEFADGDGVTGAPYEPPYTRGSHASRLITGLLNGTICNNQTWQDMGLTRAEFVKLVTFVDSKAQFYGTYFGRKPLSQQGEADFRPVPTFESATSHEPPYWSTGP
jgi:hypothetical protein